MKKSIVFSSLLAITTGAQAELQTLDNQQLQMVEAQAGAATINWSLSLNQTSPGVFDNQQDAFAAVNLHRAFEHFIRRRRGEDVWRPGLQHAHLAAPGPHERPERHHR